MQLQISAKLSVLCFHLANTNEDLGKLIKANPLFTRLLLSLFTLRTLIQGLPYAQLLIVSF